MYMLSNNLNAFDDPIESNEFNGSHIDLVDRENEPDPNQVVLKPRGCPHPKDYAKTVIEQNSHVSFSLGIFYFKWLSLVPS